MKRLIVVGGLMGLLSACSSMQPDKDIFPDDPAFAPVSAQSLAPPPQNDGSLFQARYSVGLYTDQQATRVGDIITVIFDEEYQSSKSAETSAGLNPIFNWIELHQNWTNFRVQQA